MGKQRGGEGTLGGGRENPTPTKLYPKRINLKKSLKKNLWFVDNTSIQKTTNDKEKPEQASLYLCKDFLHSSACCGCV